MGGDDDGVIGLGGVAGGRWAVAAVQLLGGGAAVVVVDGWVAVRRRLVRRAAAAAAADGAWRPGLGGTVCGCGGVGGWVVWMTMSMV